MSLVIANSLDEALAEVASGARPIAGGTDLVVASRQGTTALPDALVAIDRLTELRGIRHGDEGARIGAIVTHAELMSDATIVASYTALADAAALVGSPSTRNVGTLGGNVMNASPAMLNSPSTATWSGTGLPGRCPNPSAIGSCAHFAWKCRHAFFTDSWALSARSVAATSSRC